MLKIALYNDSFVKHHCTQQMRVCLLWSRDLSEGEGHIHTRPQSPPVTRSIQTLHCGCLNQTCKAAVRADQISRLVVLVVVSTRYFDHADGFGVASRVSSANDNAFI